MVCANCPDLQLAIRNKAPYANRNDVIEQFNSMTGSCCVGVPTSTFLNPSSSDATAATMASEAFPDGSDDCYCPCKYIVDTTNDKIYVNCTNSLSLAANWTELSESCVGVLTTIGLDPSVNPVASMAEAFPLGLSTHCNTPIIIGEGDAVCFSRDGGASFTCLDLNSTGTTPATNIFVLQSTGTVGVASPIPIDNSYDNNLNLRAVVSASSFYPVAGTFDIVPFTNTIVTGSTPVISNLYMYLYDTNAGANVLDIDGNSVRTMSLRLAASCQNPITWLSQRVVFDGTEVIEIRVVGTLTSAFWTTGTTQDYVPNFSMIRIG